MSLSVKVCLSHAVSRSFLQALVDNISAVCVSARDDVSAGSAV